MYSNPKKFYTRVVWLLLASMIWQSFISPLQLLALTNGAKQPEFDSFTPVSTTNMVNTFSGNFSYNIPVLNIPGADGGGYALSLAYDANPTVESQSSWVGLNWTLNPGALDRQLRGLPDDWKGKEVVEYNKTNPNFTVGTTSSVGLEFVSSDNPFGANISLGSTTTFNNYSGFRKTSTAGVSFSVSKKLGAINGTSASASLSAGLSVSLTGNDVSFNTNVSVGVSLSKTKTSYKLEESKTGGETKIAEKSRTKFSTSALSSSFSTGGTYGIVGRNFSSLAPTITPYTGIAFNYELKGRFGTQFGGVQVGLSGFFNAQWNNKKNTYAGYGYMYNPHRSQYDAENVMADYYMEKAAPYSMRDNVIGIPFNNADYFNATGEGLIGSFSLRHNEVGHFYANGANSNLFIVNMGFNVNTNVPAGFGLGSDFGVGYQRVAARKWLNESSFNKNFNNNTDNYEYTTGDSLPYFRFKNDLGGNISYSESLGLSSATLEKKSNFPGTKKFYPVVDTNLNTSREIGAYTGQSSHIAYVLNSEINDSTTAQNNAFEKNSRILDFTTSKRENVDYADEIAQIKAWNPDGIQYTYGLPSYVEGEKTLSYGIKNGSVLKHNYLIYQDIDEEPLENNIVVGEEKKGAYASTFLLTQITTADYVDVLGDGVSEDDFGGYTQFDYKRWSHGDTAYYFRAPYTGLYYNIGRLADGRDDMGMVSDGYKEIYYLNAIETKSHVALFITNKTNASEDFAHLCGGNTTLTASKYNGSGNMRLDALGANDSVSINYNLRAANTIGLKNPDQDLEKLERIVVFAKEDLDQSLVTTHFEYDYSAWSNLPNNINGAYPNTSTKASSGKLTLKKLWFEYEGVRNYKISPYEFGYTYKKKNTFEQEVLDRYATLFSDWSNFSTNAETPSYNPHAKDMWGYHQYKGEAQKDSLRPWVYQGNYDKDIYDPAAWQLKQIKLPSGGEILIQYEQKDYQKVQDRDPLAMVRLRPISLDDRLNQENKFYLATEDLGLNIGDAQLDDLAEKIRKKYIQNPKNKIYFKFLYALKGYNPQIADGDGEYISGYSSVEAVGVDGTEGLWIRLGKNNSNKEYFDRKSIPRKLCYDYMIYQYNFGDLAAANMRNFEENNINSNSSKTDSRSGAAFALGFKVIGEVVEKVLLNVPFLPTEDAMSNSCRSINYPLSYIRIPMNTPKKGGGVRVKRLLMYDKGIEVGAAQLYGTEYTYETIDGKSSGVATNEPATGREENALVEYLQRDMPHGAALELERMFAGDDKKELEAPFGESLLPVPSIGHSRVVVENIFKGKSNAGHSVSEFYTCADYPYDGTYYYSGVEGYAAKAMDYTKIAGKNNKDHKRQDYMMLPLGVVNYYRNELWVTQGWRFYQNQMHGKPKTEQVFAGVYNQINARKASPSIETVYEYYEPGEKVDVLSYDQTAKKYLVDKRYLGMDMDVTMAMQSIKDETFDLNIEFDIDFALYFVVPVISFTIMPSFTYSQQGYSSHLTSKVVNFPAVTKSVTTTKNNVRNKTEYLAFSDLTGAPVLTKVTDGYDNTYVKESGNNKHDGSIYNWSIPAAWFYKDLGQKTATNNAFNQLNVMAGSISSYGSEGNILDSIVGGNELTWTTNPKNVLAASAATFSKGWLGDEVEILANYDVPSSANSALDSIWRMENTYAFESTLSNGTGTTGNEALYQAGIIQDFSMFDWLNPPASTTGNWRWVNGVSKYSPNGMPLEEVNSLGIPSTAKYGYHKFLPILMAQNAEYTTVGFESFEDETTVGSATTNAAHAGKKSLAIPSNNNQLIFSDLKITDNLLSKERGGLQVKLWAYSAENIDYTKIKIKLGANLNLTPKIVARTGKWTLLSAEILPGNLSLGDTPNLSIENESSATVYVDDVRIQPRYSEMVVYVYDAKNFKLLASFDDEHFGLYYQYNEEGKLIRKLIETERGLKTIQETQYNGYAKPRND